MDFEILEICEEEHYYNIHVQDDEHNDYWIRTTKNVHISIRDGQVEDVIDCLNRNEIWVVDFKVDIDLFEESGTIWINCNIDAATKDTLMAKLMEALLKYTNNNYEKTYEIINQVL